MKIEISVKANAGCGKTIVSRVIEKALRDAGFEVNNTDADVPLQAAMMSEDPTRFDAALRSLSERNFVEIVTVQAPRAWLTQK